MISDKAPDAFRTISEAAEDLGLEQHVLRFWETRFSQIKPLKRGGGRRYYRPDDVEFLRGLKHLLHNERYTIKGVQKIIKEQGVKVVIAAGRGVALAPPSPPVVSRVARPMTVAPRPVPVPVAPPPPAPVPANAGASELLAAAMAELTAAKQILAAA